MNFTLSDALQFTNLLLIPAVIYIVKIERQLARSEMFAESTRDTLRSLGDSIAAAHRRLDRLRVPAAGAEP